jgi:hypothetical protein
MGMEDRKRFEQLCYWVREELPELDGRGAWV